MPRPGAQLATRSRLSGLTSTRTSPKPAAASQASTSVAGAAARDAAAEKGMIGRQVGGQRPQVDDVGDREAPARLQHPERLLEHLRLVGHQVDHAVGQDHVRRIVGDRQIFKFSQAEGDVEGADLDGIGPRLGQHLMRHVDTDDVALGADLAGREQAVEAGAAAEVDNRLTRTQGGDRLRVAAAEAEIGAIRHRGQIVGGIAHLLRLAFGRGGIGRAAARRRAIGDGAGSDATVAGADHVLDLSGVHRCVGHG